MYLTSFRAKYVRRTKTSLQEQEKGFHYCRRKEEGKKKIGKQRSARLRRPWPHYGVSDPTRLLRATKRKHRDMPPSFRTQLAFSELRKESIGICHPVFGPNSPSQRTKEGITRAFPKTRLLLSFSACSLYSVLLPLNAPLGNLLGRGSSQL